jgi:hypothetical protein
MSSDRVELHRRLARGKWEAYANALDTRVVKYPDEWIYNPDAVIMCLNRTGVSGHIVFELPTGRWGWCSR